MKKCHPLEFLRVDGGVTGGMCLAGCALSVNPVLEMEAEAAKI